MSAKSLLTIMLCLQVSVSWAETHVVGDPYATIQAAIDAAQDGDSVVVPPDWYDENINFMGKAITVRGTDPNDWETVCRTVIAGQMGGSCVAFNHDETPASILEGLTVTRGDGTPMLDPFGLEQGEGLSVTGGGGIFCQDSSPTIRRCNITGNGTGGGGRSARKGSTHGGGIALMGACRATISHCVIANNEAKQCGGGIFVASDDPEAATSVIRHCTVADNDATGFWSRPEGYEVDCADARATITHTIIYGVEVEGLLVNDISRVTHCCLKSVHALSTNGVPSVAAVEFAGIGGNIDQGPRFTGFGSNADHIDTTVYHLRDDSPCVDAGDPGWAGHDGTDIDGQARVIGGIIDIGADEVVQHLAVERPQADDIFAAGSVHTIQWSGHTGPVDILFSADGGETWQTIATAIESESSYLWQLPEGMDSGACVISVVPSAADLVLALTDSGLFTIGPDANGPAVASEWPSLGGGYGRSGLSENEGLAEGVTQWAQETGGAVLSSVTIGSGGRVHVACEDGKLYAFEAGGAPLWVLDVNSPMLSAPSIGPDGSLFVGCEDGRLRAVDRNGTIRWTFGTGNAVYSSPAVMADGKVYFGSSDGVLYAVGADGSELWQFATKGPGAIPTGAIFASASIGTNGTVYAAGLYDPNLYALEAADGSVKWACNFAIYPENEGDPNSAKVGGWPFAAPVVDEDGTIYQTLLYDSHLYAIEPESGMVLWATDLLDAPGIDTEAEDFDEDADGWSEPALGPDGTIYVSLDDPYLRAVDPSGRIKWATKVGDVGGFTMTVDARGWVYAACDDGYVYVVDNDGLPIGRWETAGWPVYPVIAGDGAVLVADSKDYSALITDARNIVQALSINSLQDPAAEPETEAGGGL